MLAKSAIYYTYHKPMKLNQFKLVSPAVYLLGLTSILLGALSAKAAAPGAPNVIIVNLDDVAWAMVEPYINHISDQSKADSDPTNDIERDYFGFNIDQPSIQRLADEGVMMMDGYSSSPVCWPSRTGLLSGQFPARWANGNKVPDRYTTIAEYLQDDGYATMCIGKWQGLEAWYQDGGTQTSKDVDQHPLNRGFDEFFGFGWGSHSYWNLHEDGSVGVDQNGNPIPTEPNHIYKNWNIATEADNLSGGVYNPPNPESHPDPWYLTHEFSAQAVDFIERKKDEPFFIYMPYHAKHTPVQIPSYYGPFVSSKHPGSRLVDAVDIGLGEIIQKLEQHNLYDNTLIIFTSDNGGNKFFNTGLLRGRKSNLYEGGIRVPYIITWPAQLSAGLVSNEIISNTDMLPTVLGAAGISTTDTFDGNDFMPYLLGQTTQGPNQRLFWGINNVNTSGSIAMRDGDWKYLRYGGEWQLYDLSVDPLETNNLINVRTDIVNQLDPILNDWMSEMAGGGGTDPDPEPDLDEVSLYSDTFDANEGFNNMVFADLAGNGAGQATIPSSGNVVCKEVLGSSLSLNGAIKIRLDAKFQLPPTVVGNPEVSIRVGFNTTGGSVTTVNGQTIALNSNFQGQFGEYSSTIDVPSDATSIKELKVRFVQTTGGSATQIAYIDDLILTALVPTSGNPAPVVSIMSPADGTEFLGSQSIPVTVAASDGTGEVVEVQLLANGALVGTDEDIPYAFDLIGLAAGLYSLEAIAYDDEGASTTSASVDITITEMASDIGSVIEAELYDQQSGLGVYNGGTGQKIGSIENGTWARYNDFDFGSGVESFDISLASDRNGGNVEFRLGSETGQLIGTASVGGTGGWNNFVTISGDFTTIATGVHDLYLVFTGGSGSLLDVDWFVFNGDTPGSTTGAELYFEDFELGENYSYLVREDTGSNFIGRIFVPATGSVNCKDSLGGASSAIPLNGATSLSVEADLQLLQNVVGAVDFRMFVRFNISGGGIVDVSTNTLGLDNSFVGQFLNFQDAITVPAGAESINYVRMRFDQDVAGSAVQTVHADNVRITVIN